MIQNNTVDASPKEEKKQETRGVTLGGLHIPGEFADMTLLNSVRGPIECVLTSKSKEGKRIGYIMHERGPAIGAPLPFAVRLKRFEIQNSVSAEYILCPPLNRAEENNLKYFVRWGVRHEGEADVASIRAAARHMDHLRGRRKSARQA